MSHSKRVSAPENGLQCLHDQEECLSCDENDQSESTPFVPYLSHITEGCSTREVDPTACVPFHLARGYSDNAVKRLKMILNGNRASSSEMSLTGMVSGPPSSIVVPLVGDLLVLLDEYLMKKHKKEEDRQAEKDSHEQWYGIIDGCHVFFALVELREDYPLKWGTFKWRVLL